MSFFYRWADNSAGWLLVLDDSNHIVVSVSALTWFIIYIRHLNLQFLDNVIIIKMYVLLTQTQVTLADLAILVRSLGFIAPKHFLDNSVFDSFYCKRISWNLFQKRVVRTEFGYLPFYYYQLVGYYSLCCYHLIICGGGVQVELDYRVEYISSFSLEPVQLFRLVVPASGTGTKYLHFRSAWVHPNLFVVFLLLIFSFLCNVT